MTEKLKTLMDEVTGMVDHDFAAPDLDAIVRNGDRTVRTRRTAGVLAGLAAAAVTVTGVVLLAGGPGPGEEKVADTPVDSDGMSWAVGSDLHIPTGTIEVGHPVRAYVRTTAGFVTVDGKGRVWSVADDDVTSVGRMEPSSLYLTSDTEDSLAAWLERGAGDAWTWVVFDQAVGQRVATYPAGHGSDITGVVVALDDRRLYVTVDGDYFRLDVEERAPRATVDPPARDAQLLGVEDGVYAWANPDEDGGSSEYVVGRTEMEPVRIPLVEGHQAAFSPDARWVTFDADEPRVFDVATGEQVAVDLDGRTFGVGYEWLDEDSLAVMASRDEAGPIEMLVCKVPAGTCDVVAPDLGTFDGAARDGFALPVGTAITD